MEGPKEVIRTEIKKMRRNQSWKRQGREKSRKREQQGVRYTEEIEKGPAKCEDRGLMMGMKGGGSPSMSRTIGQNPTFISSAMEAIMCIKQEMTTIWPVENRLY